MVKKILYTALFAVIGFIISFLLYATIIIAVELVSGISFAVSNVGTGNPLEPTTFPHAIVGSIFYILGTIAMAYWGYKIGSKKPVSKAQQS